MALDTTFLAKSNPGINEQLMTAQQQLALAQALRGQALQPIQAPPGQNGKISPLSVIAQALGGYMSGKMMGGATHNMATAQAAQAKSQMAQMQALALQLQGGATGDAQAAPGTSVPAADGSQAAPAATAPGGAPAPATGPAASGNPLGTGLMAEMYGLDGFSKAAYDRAALTPEQKNSRDGVIGPSVQGNLKTQNMTELQRLQYARGLLPPDSPQAREIDAQIAKVNYVAPASVAPGTLALGANGRPMAYNPPAIKGGVPQFQTRDGFTTAPSVTPQAGAAGINAAFEGAEKGAIERNSVHTATGADGSTQTGFLFGGGGGGAGGGVPSAAAPAAAPVPAGAGLPAALRAPQAASRAPMPGAAPATAPTRNPGIISGPSTTDAAIQKGTSDAIAQAPQRVQQARGSINGLESALRSLENVKATGPGTARTNEIVSSINNSLGTHIDGSSTDAYQQVGKYLANSLNAAAQSTGAGGSDARFESFMHGQPSKDTMNIEPLKGAIRYVLSQHDASAAQGQFLQDAYAKARAAGDPNAAMTAQAQWSKVYKPEFFAFNRMSADEHVQYLKSLGADGAKKFVQQYNDYANQTGWVH